MPASLTEKEFSQHLNTKFRFRLEDGNSVELELVEVKGYPHKAQERSGMERFSAYFHGPADALLPQRTYTVDHDQMGEFEIFLVPIGAPSPNQRYEAIFNYFINQEQ